MKNHFQRLVAISICFLLVFLESNYLKAETVTPKAIHAKNVEAFTNKVIPEKMKAANAPGVAIVVVKDDQILFQKGTVFPKKKITFPSILKKSFSISISIKSFYC
ncbi:hypothetical protein OCA10_29140 [Bacillus cereus]|uniref:hypothetical protein n=1 Tax=Bacillus cereus TaxID=1396 RepID=UPI0030130DD7|nr:hypothetical protein [Bacillus cereus]